MGNCRLCGSVGPLRDSHSIPAFAVRWIKETSPMPFLRNPLTPNLRKQDVDTSKLLCERCEISFSKDEGTFAQKIFFPFVHEELDAKGVGQGIIRTFDYEEWLLRFVISLQWRTLLSLPAGSALESLYTEIEVAWRQFLIGKRPDTGLWENHMIFLSSLAGAQIPASMELGRRVNSYILRSVDATSVESTRGRLRGGIYSKLGPIVFYTAVRPTKLASSTDSRLHMRGTIKVGQKMNDGWLGGFIFHTRPNEAFCELSPKQKEKMTKDMLANPDKTRSSMSFHALEFDFRLEKAPN